MIALVVVVVQLFVLVNFLIYKQYKRELSQANNIGLSDLQKGMQGVIVLIYRDDRVLVEFDEIKTQFVCEFEKCLTIPKKGDLVEVSWISGQTVFVNQI